MDPKISIIKVAPLFRVNGMSHVIHILAIDFSQNLANMNGNSKANKREMKGGTNIHETTFLRLVI
jgi:hypothetical protein